MLELKNVSFQVDEEGKDIEIIRDISLTVPDRELVVVTGPNGNSIFLPAVGRKDHGDMYDIGEYGHYWSGSISSDYGHYMFELVFRDNGHYFALIHKNAEGRAVRPVQDK